MMLGKRGRPPMKRTTSMKEFTLDLNGGAEGVYRQLDGGGAGGAAAKLHRRNSADMVQTAHFLRVCSLCNSRLIPGRDIYMYRGDSAFCSLECRQQQMIQDERKEKCSLVSKKEPVTAAAAAAAVPRVSATGETVAAV